MADGEDHRLMADGVTSPSIEVTENGPYLVHGPVEIRQTDGTVLVTAGPCYLCRCGGSKNKPFCDATHGLKGFIGTETASHDAMASRRDDYPTENSSIVVHDDRSRCAHFGQCTDRLPAVFRAADEPFVQPGSTPAEGIADVVHGCPSGALTFSRTASGAVAAATADGDAHDETVEDHPGSSITPIIDGPYRVRGVPVIGADGTPYELRERQTLCRCGHSGNKPFCDGSHWYAGFRDPLPPELAPSYPTLYEYAGGIEAFEKLTTRFYHDLLTEPDPVLEPVFRHMDAAHAQHVAAWLAETFGGPAAYTRDHGGYHHMVNKHRDLGLTEQQRRRWIDRMLTTADLVGLPADPDFRAAFVSYLEWGTRIAVFNSRPGTDLIQHAPVPRWTWGAAPPFVPFPWDDPDAAERGRQRWAARDDSP